MSTHAKCNFILYSYQFVQMYFRLVLELGQKQNPNLKWTVAAVMALHTTAEAYCITLFDSTNLAAIHAHYVAVQPTDLTLVHTIHGETDMLHQPIHSNPKKKLKDKAILTPPRQDHDPGTWEDNGSNENMSNNGIDRNNTDNDGGNDLGNDGPNENVSSNGRNQSMCSNGVNEDNMEQDDIELKKWKKKKKKECKKK